MFIIYSFYVLYILTISLTLMRHIGHFVDKNAGEQTPQQVKCPQGTKAIFDCLRKQILQLSVSLISLFGSVFSPLKFFCDIETKKFLLPPIFFLVLTVGVIPLLMMLSFVHFLSFCWTYLQYGKNFECSSHGSLSNENQSRNPPLHQKHTTTSSLPAN